MMVDYKIPSLCWFNISLSYGYLSPTIVAGDFPSIDNADIIPLYHDCGCLILIINSRHHSISNVYDISIKARMKSRMKSHSIPINPSKIPLIALNPIKSDVIPCKSSYTPTTLLLPNVRGELRSSTLAELLTSRPPLSAPPNSPRTAMALLGQPAGCLEHGSPLDVSMGKLD